MHRLSFLLAALLALAAPSAFGRPRSLVRVAPRPLAERTADGYVPDEVLVRFRPGIATSKVEPLGGALGLVRVDRLEHLGVERYRIAGGGDVLETVRRLRQRSDVLDAEPNGLATLAAVPNDTYYANVDGHVRDLQRWTFGGIDGNTGIDAEAAWDLTTGRPDVTIAVIDSGLDLHNLDLAPNLWTNPGEIPGNNVDDDHNGFVDDVHGWDFFYSRPDVTPGSPESPYGDGINNDGAGFGDDNVFHGTFAANLAAGRGDDAHGVLGSAWNCTVMPLKVFTDDGSASYFHLMAAFQYAADNGADVVNASIETGTDSPLLRDGVAYAVAHDCVVVAAAGNGGSPAGVYPAKYDGVLSVGATGHAFEGSPEIQSFGPANFDGRPAFTNYGPVAVDVVAPGVVFSASVASLADANADSSLHAGDIIGLAAEGTSFASPIVAGLAALVVSRDKDLHGGVRTLTNAQVEDLIISTAVDLPDDPTDRPDGHATWDGHGRVNFLAALQGVPDGGGGRPVRLEWQTPAGGVLDPPRELTASEGASKLAAPAVTAVSEVEPNNTFATAQPVTVPTSVSGTISTNDDGGPLIVYSSGPSDVVEDLYRLSLTQETSLSVTLTPGGASDLDLAIFSDFDGNGQFEIDPDRSLFSLNPVEQQPIESIPNAVLPAGTYYIACSVYDAAPVASSDTYTLALTTGAPVVTGYRVYRSTSPGVVTSEANRVGVLAGAQLFFVDATAPDGDVYYVVTAVYAGGESAPSNEASPSPPNPDTPSVLNPVYKKGKLTLDATGSKIVAGTVLVVDDDQTFTLAASPDGKKWLVKKKARSVPGNLRIADALVAGQPSRLVVVTPGGLRSAAVMFTRP